MIYLGGKWAAKGKGDRSSARRRRAVGKNWVKRAFSALLALKYEKMMVFAKNLRFAKDLSEKWKVVLRFVGNVFKQRTYFYDYRCSDK